MPTHSLDVTITGLRSAKGMIRLCLTTDPRAFPDCKTGNPVKRSFAATVPHIRIDDIQPGTYAVAVIHDENGNAKLDTFMGIPREGFGFSRNPAVRFGPPSFKSAEFPIGGEGVTQQVKIKYIL